MFLGFFFSVSMPSVPARADDLDSKVRQEVLSAVDMICADTWCEGDYNFKFKGLKCTFSNATCVLTYDAGAWPAEGRRIRWNRHGMCRVRGVRSRTDLLVEMGPYRRLADAPYEQITRCIDEQFSPDSAP
ncbi:MAG: hypothetical protein EBX52_02995 [Proteobacteria bacterium]|nr:hypothetical protein [Pseudomonadota bacterium]